MRRLIAHRLKWDDEGVASTVGTIMALLVFLTFLSMIVNSYVPVWMKDSESSHMNVAFGQFGDLKQAVDSQVLYASTYELVGEHYIPTTSFTPITLGVDGVPIFSAPSSGELIATQDSGPWLSQFQYYPSTFSNRKAWVNETANGAVSLQVYNRYFVGQTLVYENGAVMKYQADGMVLRAEPAFEVKVINYTEEITFALISMLGYGAMTGTSTEGVHTKVVSVDTEEYKRVYTDIYINHTSTYAPAWYAYYNYTLNKAFGLTPNLYKATGDYTYTVTRNSTAERQVTKSPYFIVDVTRYYSSKPGPLVVTLKNDYGNSIPLTMPIKTLRLRTVVVNIAVGGLGAQINI